MVTKNLFLILLLTGIGSSSLWGQTQEAPRDVLHDRESMTGLQFQTNGWALAHNRYYKGSDAFNFWRLGFELEFLRHEKEVKSYFQATQARPYYYGKQNSFFVLRPGFGKSKEIAPKIRRNGVQLNYTWLLGPSIGFLKPVYLEIIYNSSVPGRPDIRTEKFDADLHYSDNIYGRSSNLTGLSETQIKMGLFFKVALRFDYSRSEQGLKGVEIGAQADVYAQRIEIMSQKILDRYNNHANNNFIFPSLYVNFYVGQKFDSK
jgi:hypothetical protein